MVSLKAYSPLCPGCFSYEQTEGIFHRWETVVDKDSLDAAVLAFREANHLPRATEAEVAEDTDLYQCARLLRNRGEKVMRRFCQDSERPAAHWVKPPPSGCRGCGARV